VSDSRWLVVSGKPGGAESPAAAEGGGLFASPSPPEVAAGEFWTLLTETRQSGLGEGPVTEGWAPREKDAEEERGGRAGAAEKPQAAPPRKFSEVRFDLRYPDYFKRAAEARKKAQNALVDPYTDLICEFGEINPNQPPWELSRASSYAYAASANLQLGRLALVNWHLRAAEAAFQRGVKADSHDPDIWWHLGVVRLFRRKHQGAIGALKTACDYRPGDLRSRIAFGLAHYHNQDYAAAEEYFGYEKGPEGRGIGARSFLICCLRMQGKWERASMEIQSLAQSSIPAWKEMAAQCARCVARGEGKAAPEKPRRHLLRAAKSAAIIGLLFFWIFHNWEDLRKLAEQLRRVDLKAAVWPAVGLLLAVAAHLKRLLKQRSPQESFGDGVEDLPCWQTRTWMRPPRLDLFGQHAEISRN